MRLVLLCCLLATDFIRCERQMDISDWYSSMVSRGAFDKELTNKQLMTKKQIEDMLKESKRTEKTKLVSAETLESYEAIFEVNDFKDETEMDEEEQEEDVNSKDNSPTDKSEEIVQESDNNGQMDESDGQTNELPANPPLNANDELKSEFSDNITSLSESRHQNVQMLNSLKYHQNKCYFNNVSSYLDVFYSYGSHIKKSVSCFRAESNRTSIFKRLKKKKSRKRTERACKMKTRCCLRCWLSFEFKMCIPRFNWIAINVTRNNGDGREEFLPFPEKTNFEREQKEMLEEGVQQVDAVESRLPRNKKDEESLPILEKKNFEREQKEMLEGGVRQVDAVESRLPRNKKDEESLPFLEEKNFEREQKEMLEEGVQQVDAVESRLARNKKDEESLPILEEKNFEREQKEMLEEGVQQVDAVESRLPRNKKDEESLPILEKNFEREQKEMSEESTKQMDAVESRLLRNKKDEESLPILEKKNFEREQKEMLEGGVRQVDAVESRLSKNKKDEEPLPFLEEKNFGRELKEMSEESSKQMDVVESRLLGNKKDGLTDESTNKDKKQEATYIIKVPRIEKDISINNSAGQNENKMKSDPDGDKDVAVTGEDKRENTDLNDRLQIERRDWFKSTERVFEKLLSLKQSKSEENLSVDKVTKIINEKSKEQLIKIQTLELSISKLENRLLKEQLSKTNDSSSIVRLENQILRLENELIKINQTYTELRQENEQMKKNQRRYLELNHGQGKNESKVSPVADSENYTLVIRQHKMKLTELTYQLRNQSELITKYKIHLEQVEDQNRMLYYIVMNQSLLISQVMKKIQILSDHIQESRQKKDDTMGLMTPTELIKHLENVVAVNNRKSIRSSKHVKSHQNPVKESLRCHRYETYMSKTSLKFDVAAEQKAQVLSAGRRQLKGGLPESATVEILGHKEKDESGRTPEKKKLESETRKDDKKVEFKAKKEDKKVEFETKKDDKKVEFETKKDDKKVEFETKKDDKKVEFETKKDDKKVEFEAKKDDKKMELKTKKDDKKMESKTKSKEQQKTKVLEKVKVSISSDNNLNDEKLKKDSKAKTDEIPTKKPKDADSLSKEKVLSDSKTAKAPEMEKKTEKVSHTRKKPLYEDPGSKDPKDCYDHFQQGKRGNGAYKIKPAGIEKYIEVFCDMKNGGWTVIQRRQGGATNFFRDWSIYKKGFGGVYGEHWIGNDIIHHLTNQKECKLRIDLADWDKKKVTAFYDYFMVEHESEGYLLHVEGFSGEGGDSLSKHNMNKFSTKDVDNDRVTKQFGGSCANRFSGAWWYHKCYSSNLNGVFYRNGVVAEKKFDGIAWKSWKGPNYSMMKTEMKIAPATSDAK